MILLEFNRNGIGDITIFRKKSWNYQLDSLAKMIEFIYIIYFDDIVTQIKTYFSFILF